MRIAIADAKSRFAELIRAAEAGEPVVITRHGKPVAELHPAVPARPLPLIGAMRGRIAIAGDFDALPDDFAAALAAPLDPSSEPG